MLRNKRRLLVLPLLACALWLACLSPAQGANDYTVVTTRYAYTGAGSVNLYKYGDDTVVATLKDGSKVAITDMREGGRTFVLFGGQSGWAKDGDLKTKLPSDAKASEAAVSYQYLVPAPGERTDLVELFMYATGSTHGGALPTGKLVAVHERQGGRAHITFGSWDVWVNTKNLSRKAADVPDASDAPDAKAEDEQAAVSTPKTPKKTTAAQKKATASGGEPAQPKDTIVCLGTVTSQIKVDGETRDVPTSDVRVGGTYSGRRTGVVHAPRTGKATLRAKASEKSDVIGKLTDGDIVLALEKGARYTLVQTEKKRGYVLNSALAYPPADAKPQAMGVLTYDGKATGRTTINIRGDASGKARKVEAWRTGTRVVVWGEENGFYEVEANGVRGFAQKKYVTLE